MKIIALAFLTTLISLTSISFSQDEINKHTNVKFKLYETNDKLIFLKLNTQNGLIWQVKYDIDGDNRFQIHLNTINLVSKENEVNNRFALYPTSNIYTFILMDQINGNLWQVHWSEEAEGRAIVPID